jgi:hypothetical protein
MQEDRKVPKVRKLSSARARAMAEARWARQRQAAAAAVALPADIDAMLNQVLGGAAQPTPAEPGLDVASALVGIQNTLREVPFAVVLAAAECGLPRATAERLGDLAALLAAETVAQSAERAGLAVLTEAIAVPAPDAWRATVAWDALFDAAGASAVAGAIAADSAAEAAA